MVKLTNLVKTFPDRRDRVSAVDNISLEVAEGSFYTLPGPSGCGKTTSLRCIAGLERPDSGEIEVAGEVVYSSTRRSFVPPYRRPIGMVFENVAVPLRVGTEKLPSQKIKLRVEESLALVQLDGLQGRLATQLPGGQPKVLLASHPIRRSVHWLYQHVARASASGAAGRQLRNVRSHYGDT